MATEREVRKKKKRRKKHYFLRLVVVIALLVGMYLFLNLPFFDLTATEVRNNNYYTKEQVISLTEMENGDNIFFDIKPQKVKHKLLEDPYIKNAKVKRKFPHTIVVELEEREEKAAVKYGSSYIILDPDGLVLRQSDVEPKVTILEGLTLKNIEPGHALDVEENYEFSDTLDLIKYMAESEVYFKRIDISGVRVKAYIYDKLVCIGTPDSIVDNLKNGGLEQVLYELYGQGVERGTITVGADGSCAFSAEAPSEESSGGTVNE